MTVSVTSVDQIPELPVISEAPPARADAVRNREKVLAAAERLFAELGPCSVSMDAVAAAAGVGKGTLFRHFGDRAGLVQAVLSERERRFQEGFIRGPAPLGPGASPAERLIAFGEHLFQHLAEHGDLITIAEAAGARYKAAPYGVYRAHVSMLVREADPACDWEYIADMLLAALSAQHVDYLRTVREMPEERIAAGWADLVRRVIRCR
jgi:AcrR family transcriptional regulator